MQMSEVCTVTRLRAAQSEVRIPARARDFSYVSSEAHPASYSMGTPIVSRRVEWAGRDADQSPPSNAEIKNEWSCISTPLTHVHGVDSDKMMLSHWAQKCSMCTCQLFNSSTMMEEVHVKLNPGLPWQKLHSARRRLFLPANWT